MEQYLIDRLWKHTRGGEEEDKNIAGYPATKEELFQNLNAKPRLLPAAGFFPDASSELFMSFHNEAGNYNRHYHDFFEIIYVCKGYPVGVIDDQELRMQEGNLCIMNPNAVHFFLEYSEATDLILNILLPKELFQKSIFRVLFSDPVLNAFFIRYRVENEGQPSFLFLPALDKDIDRFIEILLKEYLDRKRYSHVIIEALLTLIFSFILRSYKDNTSHGNAAMAEIIDYIYLNYQNISMNEAAARFNYHPKYLSALIHKQTGQSFRQLLVSIKLQNSINYLLYTDFSIEQIVELIGYRDKSSFYSLFKRIYHMSPSQFRNSHR